jgi:2-methylcitrate dehydratase PrpD
VLDKWAAGLRLVQRAQIIRRAAEGQLVPASDSHARVSLQYSLAEALYLGELGKQAYQADSLRNPDILALARRVHYYIDPNFPGPGRFKGTVKITLKDGRHLNRSSKYKNTTEIRLRIR